MTTHSLGQAIDGIWDNLPKDHVLRQQNPKALPSPHEHYLMSGETIIAFCEMEGALPYAPLAREADQQAWLRLVSAWAFWQRDQAGSPSRASVAFTLKIDPSNLTNFLNGKRALTSAALLKLAEFLGVQPYDIRPEMGANSAYSVQRKSIKHLHTVRNGLHDIELDLLALKASGVPVDNLMKKMSCVLSTIG